MEPGFLGLGSSLRALGRDTDLVASAGARPVRVVEGAADLGVRTLSLFPEVLGRGTESVILDITMLTGAKMKASSQPQGDMGVDQKVLARSYVFGDHSSLFKSLRERSTMEFAKYFFFSRKIPRWVLGGILCTCIFADPAPL